MIDRFVNHNENPFRNLGRYAVSIVLRIVYGLEVRDDDGSMRYLEVEEATSDTLASEIMAGGGVWAVDMMPWREFLLLPLMQHSRCKLFNLRSESSAVMVPRCGLSKESSRMEERL